eukprot:13118429-Alexandrium_andersonii.AAC.1
MKSQVEELAGLPDPRGDWSAWIVDVRCRTNAWRACVKRYVKKRYCPQDEGVQDAGIENVGCELCDRCFPSYSAVRTHMFNKHGVRNDISTRVVGTVCAMCLVDFHARKRLIKHVNRVDACKCYCLSCTDPLPDDELRELEAQA